MLEFFNTSHGYLFLGAIVGIMLGITGSGGGIIAIPMLVFILHLSLPEAIPISLMTVCISAFVGTFVGIKNGLIRLKAVIYMFLLSLITTPIGMYFAHYLPQQYLMMIFLAILVIGINTMVKKIRIRPPNIVELEKDKEPHCKLDHRGWFVWDKKAYSLLGIIGLTIGFFSGLLGAAGGFIVVPALSKISKLTMESITATSLGIVAFVGTANILFSASRGNVNWNIGIWFTIGGCVGMFLGSLFSRKISQKALQVIYITISGLTAIGLLISILIN